jgi:hypothetical protein
MPKPTKTILYYLIAAVLVIGAMKIFPSGSCGPSLDILVFLAVILLSLLLFVINLFRTLNGNKTTKIPTIIHLVGCAIFLLYLFYS